MDVLCIYHASCTDGFGAAWTVREFFKDKPGTLNFYAAHYNRPPPDVKGKEVFIVDFSYPMDVMLKLIEEAEVVHLIDHHKTAVDELGTFDSPKFYRYLNNEHSGAMLAWMYFFDREPPELIKHIQDRDLWKFELPFTKEILEAVNSFDMEFDIWDSLMLMPTEILRDEGLVLIRKNKKKIEANLRAKPIMMRIHETEIPVLNLTENISETLNEMVKSNDYPFAASFFMNHEGVIFSLRSIDSKADVSEIAKQYGGGGHRNAAGFKVSYMKFNEMLYDLH